MSGSSERRIRKSESETALTARTSFDDGQGRRHFSKHIKRTNAAVYRSKQSLELCTGSSHFPPIQWTNNCCTTGKWAKQCSTGDRKRLRRQCRSSNSTASRKHGRPATVSREIHCQSVAQVDVYGDFARS